MKESQYLILRKRTDFATSKLNNCCSIGCSYCCYQLIEVVDYEIQTIKNAIGKLDEETKSVIKANLISWFDFFDSNTPDCKMLDEHDTLFKFRDIGRFNKHKCPLLIDNKCSIYANRPLTCRVHFVERNPEVCEKDPYRESSSKSTEIRSQIKSEALKAKKYYLTFLPHIVSEVIKIDRKIKPIKKLKIK